MSTSYVFQTTIMEEKLINHEIMINESETDQQNALCLMVPNTPSIDSVFPVPKADQLFENAIFSI